MIIPRSWSCGHTGGIVRRPGETRRNNNRLPDAQQCPACWLMEKQSISFSAATEIMRKNGVVIDPAMDGCTCQICGCVYRIDFIVPAELWEKIKPAGASVGSGMLCGRCICDRLESIFNRNNEFGKFNII